MLHGKKSAMELLICFLNTPFPAVVLANSWSSSASIVVWKILYLPSIPQTIVTVSLTSISSASMSIS